MKIGASYSTVCENELLKTLVPQYCLDHPTSCKFWQRGINDTYRVQSADAMYSLRVYRHRLRSRDDIDFEMAALNHLRSQGANVAAPIQRRDGGFVSTLHAPEGVRHAIMTTHAEGSVPDYDDIENGRLFGASAADLHRRSEGFTTAHVRPVLDIDYLVDDSVNLVTSHCGRRPEDLEFLERTAAELRRRVESVAPDALDTGFCHGDFHGDNVHGNQGSLTHFDFDCCGFGYRAFELATFKWGIRGDDNEHALWAAFLDGYLGERAVSPEDLALVDTFVVIRQIWWMALIMGNARDFGHRATSDEFIDHQVGVIRKMLNQNDNEG